MGASDTVVVTGCAGLIGSHLSSHLLDLGYRVVGIDDLSGGYREWVPQHPAMTFAQLDLNDAPSVMALFRETSPSAVFHFAAYAAEGLSPFIRRFNYSNNVVASATVINASIETNCKVIFTSSMAVYGEQEPPFVESMPFAPIDPYGIAKAAVEQDLVVAGQQHGLRWSVVRPHNVIGIRQNIWDRYRNVLGIFVRKVLDGEPLSIFGDGSQLRAFSDVRFLLAPLTRLIDDHDGVAYNIGSDHPVSVLELALTVQQVAATFGYEVQLQFLDERHEVKFAYSEHRRAANDLGFADATDITQTVAEVFKWALAEPRRPVRTMDYEVTQGMYGAWR